MQGFARLRYRFNDAIPVVTDTEYFGVFFFYITTLRATIIIYSYNMFFASRPFASRDIVFSRTEPAVSATLYNILFTSFAAAVAFLEKRFAHSGETFAFRLYVQTRTRIRSDRLIWLNQAHVYVFRLFFSVHDSYCYQRIRYTSTTFEVLHLHARVNVTLRYYYSKRPVVSKKYRLRSVFVFIFSPISHRGSTARV